MELNDGRRTTGTPTSILANLGATYSNVSVYDPIVGTTPIKTYQGNAGLTVSVTDHPIIIQMQSRHSRLHVDFWLEIKKPWRSG